MKRTSIFVTILLASTSLTGLARGETVVSVTQMAYDSQGHPTCSAIRMNAAVYSSLPADACTASTAGTLGSDRITKAVYDAAGQPVQIIQAYGTTAQRAYATVAYSNNGLITDQIDANGNRKHMVYDGFDRLITYNYPSTTRPSAYNAATQATALATAGAYSTTDYEAYQYNAKSNRIYTRGRDAQVINDCYDALGRIIVHYVHAQSGCTATGGAGDVYTIYDGLGRITSRRFASTSGSGVSYVYDGLGQLASTTDMNGRTLSYQYNASSTRTQLTFPDATAIGYGLDNADRILTVGLNATAGLYSLTYDNLGRRTQLNRGSGAAVTNLTYDAFGRLATFQNDVAGTSNDISWVFSSRNPANQIVSSDASSTLYDYKETANSTVNQTYDGLNRDAAIASVSGGYDARGNLTKDASRTFTYDVENRLRTKTSTTDGQPDITLTYDPEGRLASYTSGTTTTTFLYDGVNLIGEYNSSGTLLRRYVHGDGTDEPIVWFEGSGTTDKRYLMPNYQGSIIGYTDSSGNLATVYKYGAYGEPKDISNNDSWSGVRFRYTGQTMLYEARLYYYKARVYDPAYGHFMQTDPIGSKDDLDLYSYVHGDPVNSSDPSGLATCINCTPPENDNYEDAEAEARRRLARIQAALDAYLKDPNSDAGKAFAAAYELAFGTPPTAGGIAQLKDVINGTREFLTSDKYKVQMVSSERTGGRDGTIIGGIVSYRRDLFQGKRGLNSHRTRTVLHEPMHTIAGYGRDRVYSDVPRGTAPWAITDLPTGQPDLYNAHKLANRYPDRAKGNATNYEYFVYGSFGGVKK